MCGIVGYVGVESAAEVLLEGLKRLEYRGYDSAGVAVHNAKGELSTRRAVGKLRNLENALKEQPLEGNVGIGHTRWATHGKPSEINAHPHVAGPIAVVHNGIIENHLALRAELEQEGREILSDTDTEIAAHLIHRETEAGHHLEQAVKNALERIEGAYALAVLHADEPGRIVVARHHSPLVLGMTEEATLCASDMPALLPYTDHIVFLEDGDIAILEQGGFRILGDDRNTVERPPQRISWSPVMAEKSGYKHFMLKEIFEQPRALEDTIRGRLNREESDIEGPEIQLSPEAATEVERVVLLACGTSHHATLAARYWLESIAKLPTVVELASEFRGRGAIVGPKDLVVAVSQSGETIDTLVAAKEAKASGAKLLVIANVIGCAMSRIADATFYTHAGPEIGVASTKCFSAQLANLLMLTLWLGRRRNVLSKNEAGDLIEALARIPEQVQRTLSVNQEPILELARTYAESRDVLFLGRGLSYPVALEGALKLKEISYIHAEGYAAGEMKHGPIALLDAHVPVIVVAPRDDHYERTLSNLQEAKAREAKIIAIVSDGDSGAVAISDHVISLPEVNPHLTPFLTTLPLQLFAYHVADLKGTDVDQPRNLAKTVTVE